MVSSLISMLLTAVSECNSAVQPSHALITSFILGNPAPENHGQLGNASLLRKQGALVVVHAVVRPRTHLIDPFYTLQSVICHA